MADLYSAILNAERQRILQSDPFMQGQATLQKQPVQPYDPRHSTANHLIGGLIKGMFGGGMQAVGEMNTDRQMVGFGDQLTQAIEQPEDLRMDAFRDNPTLSKYAADVAAAKRDEEKALQIAIEQGLGRQGIVKGDNGQLELLPGISTVQQMPEAQKKLADQVRLGTWGTDQKREAVAQAIEAAPTFMDARQIWGEGRRQEAFDMQVAGTVPKTLNARVDKAIESAQSTYVTLRPLYSAVDQLEKMLPESSRYVKLTLAEIQDRIPATDFQAVKDWLDYGGLQALYKVSGGQINEKEIKTTQDFMSGNIALSIGDLKNRLKYIQDQANGLASASLRNAMAQPQYQKNASAAAYSWLGTLEDEDRKQWAPRTLGEENFLTQEKALSTSPLKQSVGASGLSLPQFDDETRRRIEERKKALRGQ